MARVAVIVDAALGQRPRPGRSVGSAGAVYDARWSPDGKRIALLQGQDRSIDEPRGVEVAVCSADGDLKYSYVRVPEYLVPRAIDW